MAALLLSLLAVGGTPAAPSDPSDLPEVIGYDEFKLAFGRRFDASDDATALEASRRGHFEDTVAFIRAHNAEADAGLQTFRCGVNQYADLSPDEFRALLGNRPSVQRPPVAEELARVDAGAIPPTVDWRTKNAVSPVKNQGQCGACWAFSVTGAVEGAYAIATGALRSLSEQQLMDCDIQNSGCQGGNQANGFSYVFSNKGLDSEKEYTYDGGNDPCWVAAEKRVAASIDGSSAVPASNETALAAAVAQVPVSVSVQATTAFRNYKTGVFTGAPSCGATVASLDHAVLAVGYTADVWIVKNSWGLSFGQKGFINMKRNLGPSAPQGTCGIAADPSFAVKAKGSPAPLPPPTPGSKPALPCNCSRSCRSMCAQVGQNCCGGGPGGCSCSTCPSCAAKHNPVDYSKCGGSTTDCPQCMNGYKYCAPGCTPPGNHPTGVDCPKPASYLNTSLPPYCMFKNNGAAANNVCGLLCTVTAKCNKSPADGCCVWSNGSQCDNGGCPTGAVCYPLNDTAVPDACAKGTASGNNGDCGTCLFK